jgi:hypothetical protein
MVRTTSFQAKMLKILMTPPQSALKGCWVVKTIFRSSGQFLSALTWCAWKKETAGKRSRACTGGATPFVLPTTNPTRAQKRHATLLNMRLWLVRGITSDSPWSYLYRRRLAYVGRRGRSDQRCSAGYVGGLNHCRSLREPMRGRQIHANCSHGPDRLE